MNDFIDELWLAFADETEEHLASLEILLKKAENGLSLEDVAILYRDIHSIANLARAMDLTGMTQIAHGCEVVSLMARDGRAQIDLEMVKLLQESCGVISQMRRTAVSSRSDSKPPNELEVRLKNAPSCFSTKAKADLPRTSLRGTLREDPEMLEFYASILKYNIPRLTTVVSNDYRGTEKQHEIVIEALCAIKKGSEGMGYDHVTSLLERLAPQIPAQGPLSDQTGNVVPMFVELKQMTDNFERETKADAGGNDFSSALKEICLNKLDSLFDDMVESLTIMKGGESGGDPESRREMGDRVSSLAKAAHGYMLFASPESTGYALIFIEDIFNRIARGEIVADSEAIASTIKSVALEKRICNEKNLDRRCEIEAENSQLIERIKDIVSAGERSRFKVEIDAEAEALLLKVKIKPEIRELISAENMSDLLDALRKGWGLFEITTYLESDEQVAEAFMEWALNRAKVITNRSLIIGKESWFEFLVVCESPAEVVLGEIKTINPKGDLLQVNEC